MSEILTAPIGALVELTSPADLPGRSTPWYVENKDPDGTLYVRETWDIYGDSSDWLLKGPYVFRPGEVADLRIVEEAAAVQERDEWDRQRKAEAVAQVEAIKYEANVRIELDKLRVREEAKKLAAGGTGAGPLTVFHRSDLRARPALGWHIEDLIQESGLAVLGGEPGLGKSFLALDIGASVATGSPWHGSNTEKGRVLYVAAEGVEGLEARLSAWESSRGIEIPEDEFLVMEGGFVLTDDKAVRELSDIIRDQNIRLVILDTLSQLAGVEDENAAAQLARTMNSAKALRMANEGASVLLVHHTGKGEKARLRGSSAIKGNVDAVIIAKGDSSGFWISTKAEHDGKQRNAAGRTWKGFSLQQAAGSAAISRAVAIDPDEEAIERVLSDGDAHGMREILDARGQDDEATRKRLVRRLNVMATNGVVKTEGADKNRTYRSTERKPF